MSVSKAIKQFKLGNPIIVFDHESRENEGDIVLSAQHATPENISGQIQGCCSSSRGPATPAAAAARTS